MRHTEPTPEFTSQPAHASPRTLGHEALQQVTPNIGHRAAQVELPPDISQAEIDANRTELLQAYSPFEPFVDRLKTELANTDIDHLFFDSQYSPTPLTITHNNATCTFEFLGEGTRETALLMQDAAGAQHVVRVPNKPTDAHTIDQRLEAAVRVSDIPNVEHAQAASLERQVFISQPIAGTTVRDLNVPQLREIPAPAIEGLAKTVASLHKRGIRIDTHPENIFYDTAQGFNIIDVEYPAPSAHTLDQLLKATATTLETMGPAFSRGRPPADIREQILLGAARVERFRDAAIAYLPPNQQDEFYEIMNARIAYTRSSASRYN